MTKALLYARTATQNQNGINSSILDQLATMRRYAEEQGNEIAGEYVDEGLSGNTDARPAFQQMIAEALRGNADVILVERLDRLFRNHLLIDEYRLKLGEQGIVIVSVTEGPADGGIGLVMQQCLSLIEEWQSREHSKRVRLGFARAKQRRSEQLGGQS